MFIVIGTGLPLGATITSLGVFKKGVKEVCVIGITDFCVSQDSPKNKDNRFDAQDKAIFLSFLKKWGNLPKKITGLLLEDKQSLEMLAQQEGPYISLYGSLLALAQAGQYAYGSISFVCSSPKDDIGSYTRELVNENFNELAFQESAQYYQFPCSSYFELDKLFSSVAKLKKGFFGKRGLYSMFEQDILQNPATYLRKPSRDPVSFGDYFKEIETFIQQLNTLRENLKESAFSGYITKLSEDFITHKKNLESFVALYNDHDVDAPIIKILLNVIKAKQSFTGGLDEFNKVVLSFIYHGEALKSLLIMRRAITQCDALFCVIDHGIALYLHDLLKALGFEEKCYGVQTSSLGKTLIRNQRVFKDEELKYIFATMFTTLSLKEEDIKVLNDPITGEALRYYDAETQKVASITEAPVLEYKCSLCAHTGSLSAPYVSTLDGEVYCSPRCFLRMCTQQSKEKNDLLTLLNEDTVLQEEDKLILERLAALSYYQFLILFPSTTTDTGLFYTLPHKELLNSLASLIERIRQGNPAYETTLWQKALALAGLLGGTSLEQIKLFCDVFVRVKALYCHEMLANSMVTQNSYEHLLQYPLGVGFDQEGRLKKLQNNQALLFAKTMHVQMPLKPEAACLFYYELYRCICNKLKTVPRSLKELMIPEDTEIAHFEELMHEFCTIPVKPERNSSTKQPSFTPVSKKEETKPQPSFSALSPLTTTIEESEISEFEAAHPKVSPVVVKTIEGTFAKERYSIKLYNVKNFLSLTKELEEAYILWKTCPMWQEAYRLRVLFALYQSLEEATRRLNAFSVPTLSHPSLTKYDATITEKLDLHHLFSHQVDTYLKKYGVVERVEDCIQVSIPGEITLSNGTKTIGFFQYTFNKQWLCIHRCFKPYDCNLKENTQYISKTLRTLLYDFIKKHEVTKEYQCVLQDLENILGQS
jgi:hypothetical protein